MCCSVVGGVSGSLQFQETQESDEGKYECVAENNVGISYSYGANLYVRGKRGLLHVPVKPVL